MHAATPGESSMLPAIAIRDSIHSDKREIRREIDELGRTDSAGI